MSVSAEKWIELQTELNRISSQVSIMIGSLSMSPWTDSKREQFNVLVDRACKISQFLEDSRA